MMSRIFLQSDYNSRETVKSITAAKSLNIPIVWGSLEKRLPTDTPIGDEVEEIIIKDLFLNLFKKEILC